MCKASLNLESLYRKGVYEFFKRSDSNGLGILSQAADGGHIGASYVLAIISIFNGDESMREG
uniref:At2g35280-like TPR domain-containing protein n=1 Tax=Solanum tuberosum TaxID=4113 RepID=M1DVT9_SOLTU